MGQKMFGWIDRRLKQVSGLMDTLFGGFPIILVGDIAQLPPVLDKPLYYLVSLAADQQEFRELLLTHE